MLCVQTWMWGKYKDVKEKFYLLLNRKKFSTGLLTPFLKLVQLSFGHVLFFLHHISHVNEGHWTLVARQSPCMEFCICLKCKRTVNFNISSVWTWLSHWNSNSRFPFPSYFSASHTMWWVGPQSRAVPLTSQKTVGVRPHVDELKNMAVPFVLFGAWIPFSFLLDILVFSYSFIRCHFWPAAVSNLETTVTEFQNFRMEVYISTMHLCCSWFQLVSVDVFLW